MFIASVWDANEELLRFQKKTNFSFSRSKLNPFENVSIYICIVRDFVFESHEFTSYFVHKIKFDGLKLKVFMWLWIIS